MMTCKDCGAEQPIGSLFCEECGYFLLDAPERTTTPLPFTQYARHPAPPPQPDNELHFISGDKKVTFVIPSSRHRLTVNLTESIRVGRSDPENELYPELDLTEHQGANQGVSRLHAAFRLTEEGIVLVDLSSTNGTLLNHYRLSAEQPYFLKNGDEIHFGELLVHVFFQEDS